VLNSGLANRLPGGFALWWTITGLLCFLLGALMGTPPGPASIAGTVVIGPLINIVLGWLPEVDRLLPRLGLMAAGIAVIAVAICLTVSTELGPGPPEVVMLGLVRRGIDVVPARWITDGVPFLLGVVLGGSFGVGTIVFVIAMGTIVKFGLRLLHFQPSPDRQATLALVVE
jgi:uncharacterized membrane protein YczE